MHNSHGRHNTMFRQLGVIFILLTWIVSLASVYAENNTVNKEPLPLDSLRIFTAVFSTIKQEYVDPVADKKLIEGAIKGMVSSLDPHSTYLDRESYQNLMRQTHGKFGGIGIEITPDKGAVRVITAIEDTPAYHAGIKNNDLIVKIDDTPVQGMTTTEAVNKMRGKPNTAVLLTIIRKDVAKPLLFRLKRTIIKIQSVKKHLIEPNYGYIRIAQFQEHTTQEVVQAISELVKENQNSPLQGIIVDLRNNPGGIIQSAIGVPAIFLPKNALIVYTTNQAASVRNKLYADPRFYVSHTLLPKPYQSDKDLQQLKSVDPLKDLPDWLKSVPLVVLVNSASASASEIVAGALQDHQRAVIAGTQTFGKGSVQIVIPIDGGNAGLRLTISRYFTPQGRSIQATGIMPDIVVEENSLNKPSAVDPLEIREVNLRNHINNSPVSVEPEVGVQNQKNTNFVSRYMAQDYQLQYAFNILKIQQLIIKKVSNSQRISTDSGQNAQL